MKKVIVAGLLTAIASTASAWNNHSTVFELTQQIKDGLEVIRLQGDQVKGGEALDYDAFREAQAEYYAKYGRSNGYVREGIESAQERIDYIEGHGDPDQLRDELKVFVGYELDVYREAEIFDGSMYALGVRRTDNNEYVVDVYTDAGTITMFATGHIIEHWAKMIYLQEGGSITWNATQ